MTVILLVLLSPRHYLQSHSPLIFELYVDFHGNSSSATLVVMEVVVAVVLLVLNFHDTVVGTFAMGQAYIHHITTTTGKHI